MQFDMGSIADWVSAIGTGGALLLSLYFIVRDRRRAQEESRSAQARQVVAWPSFSAKSGREFDIRGQVSNASSDPVFDVSVAADGDEDASLSWVTPGLPDVLPPQSSAEFKLFGSSSTRLALHFTDAHGIRWIRRNGQLQQAPAT